jgi:hypothetical protein
MVAILLCWLLASCGGDPPATGPVGGAKAFGEDCQRTEDCSSLLCVRLDESGGVCSLACQDARSCPASDNWDCLAVPGQSFSVCSCLKLSDTEICADGLDNDCDGKVDDCRVCAGRPVPSDDHEHCGTCDHACRGDQQCEGGACECPITNPDECGGACTRVQTDPSNCGACGTVCAASQVCSDGSCICADLAKPDFCPGSGCVDASSDSSNCGSCGSSCALGQVCSEGDCVCPTGTPPDFCDGVGCVDLQQDINNCGECGAVCFAGQLCSAGECECPSGLELCGETCLDTRTNKAHCGACDNACADAHACTNGACGCSAVGLSVCAEGCANLQSDTDHCGKCETSCAEGEVCSGSCNCTSGVYCDTACMPVGDEQNCGECGHVCPAGQYCDAGSCECQGFGLTQCGDNCFDANSDEQHCGDCDTACRTGELCYEGECECPAGQTYCESAGKCVSLNSDAANCGTCGSACDPTEICSNQLCQCATAGQLYCAAEGKCVDTLSNTARCGSCEKTCKPTEICAGGACDCSGYSEQFCASANQCVDVWTDEQHCGVCDRACPAATHCSGGGCSCDAVGQTLCGSACKDLQNDADNCGACGNDCTGTFICSAGKCRCPDPTVGTAVRLTDNAVADYNPAAAWDGTHVGVAYQRRNSTNGVFNLRFALLNPDGTVFKDVALTSYTDASFEGVAWDSRDRIGITWNGTEYAVVWFLQAQTTAGVRLTRVSAAGVASAHVTVATYADLMETSRGTDIGWSASYGGYIISGSLYGQAYYRRIGPTGVPLETPNFVAVGEAIGGTTSLAIAPDGRALVANAGAIYAARAIFNADGSRTQPLGYLGTVENGTDAEALWDGVTLSTLTVNSGGSIRLYREGSTQPWLELLASVNGTRRGVDAVWLGNSLAVGTVESKTYQLRRYSLTSDLNAVPSTFHNTVTVVPTANVIGKTDLVQAGAGKLLAIWPDDRWGSGSELYAAPIDLKACP